MGDHLAALLKRRQAWRYAIMRTLYEKSGAGAFGSYFSWHELNYTDFVPDEEAYSTLDYLKCEGLLKEVIPDAIAITHAGVVEVEESIERPQKSTNHFPARVIQQFTNNITINAPVGAVQTGNHNTAQLTHNIGHEAAESLQQLRQHAEELPAEKRAEAVDVVHDIECAFNAPKPRVSTVRALCAYLISIFTDSNKVAVEQLVNTLVETLAVSSRHSTHSDE